MTQYSKKFSHSHNNGRIVFSNDFNFRRISAFAIVAICLVTATTQHSEAAPASFLSPAASVGEHSTPIIAAAALRWYQGGTLHQATYRQWLQATERNRLATASDWAAKMLGEPNVRQIGMEGLKIYAASLVICVSTAGTQDVMNMQVAEMAAACHILMGM